MTANAMLVSLMRHTFAALKAGGAFRSSPPAMPAGYAKALAAQKDKR